MIPPNLAFDLASETVLILAGEPADVARHCAPWIAALARAGRPPFVVVLTDGPTPSPGPGPAPDRAVRNALRRLGLDGARMLMFGIAGAPPPAGPLFDAAVRAVCFVTWRHDCNLLLVPPSSPAVPVARAASAQSGIGLGECSAGSVRLLSAPRQSARDG